MPMTEHDLFSVRIIPPSVGFPRVNSDKDDWIRERARTNRHFSLLELGLV